MQNRVTLHYIDGKIVKGETGDFFPNKATFHLTERDSGTTVPVDVASLKAVFFVKNFEGDAGYQKSNDGERVGCGKKIRVAFKDGETLVGYTQGYSKGRPGFILFPADENSNNDRVFIVNSATEEISFF
ncbi:MAG TPA: hypothetical protein VJ955_04885 [Desulfuromonadales bacterium]|nr:hypothetical protein [Desulfuromonadales bacterium]